MTASSPPILARQSQDAKAPTSLSAAQRRKLLTLGLGALLLAGAARLGDNWWQTGRFVQSTDDAYVGANVTPIAPHVAGFVQQVLVTDNQFVHAGQPLIRLDPRDLQAALDHAQAVVAERRAALGNLQAQTALQQSLIHQAAADLASNRANTVFAGQESDRYESLAESAAGSRQNAERALAGLRSAQAGTAAGVAALAAANQQLAVLNSQIAGAQAGIAQAEADLRAASLDVGYAEIDSPIDGYIGDRYAQVGTYVATGTGLLSVVPTAGLWVDANFKEDQLAAMQPGDPATITADALPGRVFHGHVLSLAPATGAVFSVIPPQNATGNFTKIVQRVPVRILLDVDGSNFGLLRPGLSTTVSVDTKHKADAS